MILKFKRAYLKFLVYGHKQTDIHTHARAQCSHASVGLAQARPNNTGGLGEGISYWGSHGQTVRFPEAWKLSLVVPIPKGNEQESPSNSDLTTVSDK